MIVGGVVDEIGAEEEELVVVVGDPNRGAAEGVSGDGERSSRSRSPLDTNTRWWRW